MALGVDIPLDGDAPSTYVQKVKTSLEAIDAHDHTNDPVKRVHADAVDGTSLELSGGQIRVKDAGVTSAKLSPSFGGLVPSGTILPFAANISSPPSGYLKCDGTTYNVATYPTLGALLGSRIGGNGTTTFAVPDMRGRFLRGRDTSATVDPDSSSRSYNGGTGNLIGSYQTSQYPSHTHSTGDFNFRGVAGSPETSGFGGNNQGPGNTNFTLNAQNSVTESRPKNVYVEFIIKT